MIPSGSKKNSINNIFLSFSLSLYIYIIFTYLGLQVFGKDAIKSTTAAHIANKPDKKAKKVHFRINGQFHATNEGASPHIERTPL